ncbi:MAG: SMEK domain-containing protein [Bacteroidetes bacterium]|nr:SMEK domain-containing protein [Bacteroidota bacterium]
MISRGIIIGKLIDDLSLLEHQIISRNKLGQFDLTKVCEDFFREIINTGYGLNLKNPKALRSNNPGLDLGDESKEIAF